jgi:peroxiredoxin
MNPAIRSLATVSIAMLGSLAASAALAEAVPGKPAPAFSLTDVDGKKVSLADLRGKTVVLEWTNPSCPFVQKHYGSGNMQGLQKRAAADGVTWVTINSTHSTHGEYQAPTAKKAWIKQQNAAPGVVALDAEGAIGRAYGAKTTPHMFVINPAGQVVYAGAIDDKRSANPADIKGARNHVTEALADLRAGRAVAVASTAPYGCSVKYAGG